MQAGLVLCLLLTSNPGTGAADSSRVESRHKAEASCEAGNAASCAEAGCMYEGRCGFEGDRLNGGKAVRFHGRACELGLASSCTAAGALLQSGVFVSKDVAKAVSFYEKGCAGGDAEACWTLGDRYRIGHDHARAVPSLEAACNQHAFACGDLGLLYEEGKGVARDPAKAAQLYGAACEADRGRQSPACVLLALLYKSGRGVTQDRVKARSLLTGACAAPTSPGCLALTGWLEEDCKSGAAAACHELGDRFRRGIDVAADPVQARHYSELACAAGSAADCVEVGRAYQHGLGGPRDRDRARDFYGKACAAHYALGCDQVRWLDEPRAAGDSGDVFSIGLRGSTVTGAAASLGLVMGSRGRTCEHDATGLSWQIEAGSHGGQAGIGFGLACADSVLPHLALSVRAVAARTWNGKLLAEPDATYVGVQVDGVLMKVGVRLGAMRLVSAKRAGDVEWLFAAGVGLGF